MKIEFTPENAAAPAGCEKCNQFIDRQDVVHCVRTCKNCGRTMYVHEPGAHGLGMIVREGDIVTIPAGYFKLAFNPLKTNVRFSKAGLQWLAELIFLEQLPDQSKRDTIEAEIARAEANCIEGLSQSALLGGLNLNSDADAEKIIHLLKDRKDTAEFWRLNELSFLVVLRQALDQRMPELVAWATACAERCRTMRIYKESLEEVIWMGNSASRLLTFLQLWNEHQTNDDEEFWQIKLTEHSYVLSQAFSAPVVLIRDKAYVGGMNLDRKEARIVDFLFAKETSKDALLVELKTPCTKLLGRKYRAVYSASSELSGAVTQVLDYRRQLANSLSSIKTDKDKDLSYFSPRCLLLIGTLKTELRDEEKRKSFEIFRSGLKDIEILTFDELFQKITMLASLFNLVQGMNSANKSEAAAHKI